MPRYGLVLSMLGIAALLAAGWAWLQLDEAERTETEDTPETVAGVLGPDDEAAGFTRVTGPLPFVFPLDHGPHPAYRHEWWYVTGNLTTPDGRHFGYHVTFFRFALTPHAPAVASDWATQQVYMAHFAVTDTQGEVFHHFERFSRGAQGLAGAQAKPLAVWLDDWRLTGNTGAPFTVRLELADEAAAIDLTLAARKSPVAHGESGYSRKGDEPGNASRYYAFTRLATEGQVALAGQEFEVSGWSWMDREWGTSALGEGIEGWDWFAIQLEDGRDLMLYQLRRETGEPDAWSRGTLIDTHGDRRELLPDAYTLEPLDWWESPEGVRYPVRWRILVPQEALVLEVTPRLEEQALTGAFQYWEGAIRITGEDSAGPVTGQGYMELTGYAD